MNTIKNINGVNIVSVAEQGQRLVPIKPICEALGINFSAQEQKIKKDEILSSTILLSHTVGGDGKQREMLCLPHRYIFGWLFSINPQNVKEEARENLIKYKRECYDALFDHFIGKLEFLVAQDIIEIEKLKELNSLIETRNDVNKKIKGVKKDLNNILEEKLATYQEESETDNN